jgi:hypothetical protein
VCDAVWATHALDWGQIDVKPCPMASSLYNLFTDFVKSRSPQWQIDGTLRLTNVIRSELP